MVHSAVKHQLCHVLAFLHIFCFQRIAFCVDYLQTFVKYVEFFFADNLVTSLE